MGRRPMLINYCLTVLNSSFHRLPENNLTRNNTMMDVAKELGYEITIFRGSFPLSLIPNSVFFSIATASKKHVDFKNIPKLTNYA